jgi:hypothetical protein
MSTVRVIFRVLCLFTCVSLLAAAAFATELKIESIGPIQGVVPPAVKSAITETGFRVTLGGNVLAEIWPANSAVSEKNGSASALYPNFATGGFYGVINFPNGAADFRGQNISAGTYTLRYQLLPGDGNHLGVAPNPDFFLLVPVDVDPVPADKISYATLVKLSAKASGTAHPAAFSLAEASDKVPGAETNDLGYVIATVPVKTSDSSIKVGIIVKGTAEQ